VLGRSFAEAGELPAERYAETFDMLDLDGDPLPLERMPVGIALREHRPAHAPLRITGLDGAQRELSVTAFPLFARPGEAVGVVAIFWEQSASG
jgi:hypothetical protein